MILNTNSGVIQYLCKHFEFQTKIKKKIILYNGELI